MERPRWIVPAAVVGLALHVLGPLLEPATGRDGSRVLGVAVLLTAVTGGLALALREGRELLRTLPLLAPLGILLGAEWLVGRLGALFTFLAWGPDLGCGLISAQLSLHLVAVVAMTTLAYTWTIRGLLHYVAGATARDAVERGLGDVRAWVWRCFLALVVGHGATMLLLLLLLATGAAAGSLIVALLAVAVAACVLWNILSASLLSHAASGDEPFPRAVANAARSAWRARRHFLLPLLFQLAVLGVVVVVGSSWNASLIWVGGFAGESKWFGEVCEQREVSAPFLDGVLVVAGVWLSAAIRLRVIRAAALER